MKKSILIGALLALCASAWAHNDPWRDESLPIETRVEDLLGRLTVDEKIEELRLVNRAKWLLIECLHMTEPDAHRYITRQAMEQRTGKREIAENIIRTYQ